MNKMIISTGIDIVEIEEIKKTIERSNEFIKRVYTLEEIKYCEGKEDKYQHYAARYAAKEAVMKALGTGWDKGVQWNQIETVNTEYEGSGTGDTKSAKGNDKPKIRLRRQALVHAKELNVANMVISLSHSKYYAVAIVIFDSEHGENFLT